MDRWLAVLAGASLLAATPNVTAEPIVPGLVALKSQRPAKETLDSFERVVKARGLHVFARIDHAAGAQKIGKKLRATELLVFGKPQGGTPLMECSQTTGIDLPLKALAWEDAGGAVWLAYNDPAFLAERHGAKECGPVVENLRKALAAMAQEALRSVTGK